MNFLTCPEFILNRLFTGIADTIEPHGPFFDLYDQSFIKSMSKRACYSPDDTSCAAVSDAPVVHYFMPISMGRLEARSREDQAALIVLKDVSSILSSSPYPIIQMFNQMDKNPDWQGVIQSWLQYYVSFVCDRSCHYTRVVESLLKTIQMAVCEVYGSESIQEHKFSLLKRWMTLIVEHSYAVDIASVASRQRAGILKDIVLSESDLQCCNLLKLAARCSCPIEQVHSTLRLCKACNFDMDLVGQTLVHLQVFERGLLTLMMRRIHDAVENGETIGLTLLYVQGVLASVENEYVRIMAMSLVDLVKIGVGVHMTAASSDYLIRTPPRSTRRSEPPPVLRPPRVPRGDLVRQARQLFSPEPVGIKRQREHSSLE